MFYPVVTSDLYRMADLWRRENYNSSPYWVMSSYTIAFIKLYLACNCGHNGEPSECHLEGCISCSSDETLTLLGWHIRIDESVIGVVLRSDLEIKYHRYDRG